MTDSGSDNLRAEALAEQFHEAYERLAPRFNYDTRKASAVPWEDVPESNKSLMVAVAAEILDSVERRVAVAIKKSERALSNACGRVLELSQQLAAILEYADQQDLANLDESPLWPSRVRELASGQEGI